MVVPVGTASAMMIGGNTGAWSYTGKMNTVAILDFMANTITEEPDIPCTNINEGQADR